MSHPLFLYFAVCLAKNTIKLIHIMMCLERIVSWIHDFMVKNADWRDRTNVVLGLNWMI